eukprot:2995122-Rhodomonas_salina.1
MVCERAGKRRGCSEVVGQFGVGKSEQVGEGGKEETGKESARMASNSSPPHNNGESPHQSDAAAGSSPASPSLESKEAAEMRAAKRQRVDAVAPAPAGGFVFPPVSFAQFVRRVFLRRRTLLCCYCLPTALLARVLAQSGLC